MTQPSKVDKLILNTSQESSTSSKHDHITDALLIMLRSRKSAYSSRFTYIVYFLCKIWYQRWSNPPKLESGTINILQVWLCSWCTYNHVREQKIPIQIRNEKLCWFMTTNLISEMIQSLKTPVMNHQRPHLHWWSCCTLWRFLHLHRALMYRPEEVRLGSPPDHAGDQVSAHFHSPRGRDSPNRRSLFP